MVSLLRAFLAREPLVRIAIAIGIGAFFLIGFGWEAGILVAVIVAALLFSQRRRT